MMRREVVEQRGWVDDQEFLDLVGATNLIPGPNSTELAIHLGARRAGARGLVVAGVAFILPAAVIVTGLAWLYSEYGRSAAFVDLSYGVLPVVMAIIGQALWGLARTAIKTLALGTTTAAVMALYLVGVNELLLLAAGAFGGILVSAWRAKPPGGSTALLGALLVAPGGLGVLVARARTTVDPELARLFFVFLKIGSVLYGSGYVLLAFLQRDLVQHLGWVTKQELLDAVAIGQITPGPVFTTATFLGFQVSGLPGAVVATVGIFLPSFVFVALLTRIVGWARNTPWVRPALDGVNAASLGLMAGVTLVLARAAFPDVITVGIGIAAVLVLVRWNPSTVWLLGVGAAIGAFKLVA